jgi:hypothetical protein
MDMDSSTIIIMGSVALYRAGFCAYPFGELFFVW